MKICDICGSSECWECSWCNIELCDEHWDDKNHHLKDCPNLEKGVRVRAN